MRKNKYSKSAFIHLEKYQKDRKLLLLLLSDTEFYNEEEVEQLIYQFKNKKEAK